MRKVGQEQEFWLGATVAPAPNGSSGKSATAKPKTSRTATALRKARRLNPPRLRVMGVGMAALAGAFAYTVLTDAGRNARGSDPVLPNVEAAAAMAGLGVDQVAVTGHKFTPDGDIFEALDLAHARSFVSFDAKAAQERIEDLPWVQRAEIVRAFPGRLDVKVTERKPWAVWRRAAGDFLIDDSGRVLAAVKAGSASGLPRFSGEGAAKEAPELMKILAHYPDVAREFEEAERVGERRWTLKLKGSMTLILPPEREAQALSLYASDRAVKALTTGGGYAVDLRGANKITVRKLSGTGGEPRVDAASSAAARS